MQYNGVNTEMNGAHNGANLEYSISSSQIKMDTNGVSNGA